MSEYQIKDLNTENYAYGEPLSDEILSRNFTVPIHTKLRRNLTLSTENQFSYIPIYNQLEIHEPIEIRRPITPDLLVGKVRSWSRATNSRQTTYNLSDHAVLPLKDKKLHSVMTSIKYIKIRCFLTATIDK